MTDLNVERLDKSLGLWIEMMRSVIDNDKPGFYWPEYNCVTSSLLFVRYARLCEPNNVFWVAFGQVGDDTHAWIVSLDHWIIDPSLGQFECMRWVGKSYGIISQEKAESCGYEMGYYLSMEEEEAMLRGVVLTEYADGKYRNLKTIGAQIVLKSAHTRDIVAWTLED